VGNTEVGEMDKLFLQASQSYELMASEGACAVRKPSPPVATSGKGKRRVTQTKYGFPKSD